MKNRKITLENGITIEGATLLTNEEVEKLTKETLSIGCCWCLRSPGYFSYTAAFVYSDGSVNYFGNYVDYSYAVRPALIISNLKSSNLQIGDKFLFGNKEFEVISNTNALCTESIGCCAFREDWKSDDANDYEASDVKKFVDRWYQDIILQLSQSAQNAQKEANSEIEKENINCLENGLEITGATLLTKEEAEMLPKVILEIGEWWWLRSLGDSSNYAACVYSDGSVSYRGRCVDYSNGAVRPALEISNLKSLNLQIGDIFLFAGKEFEIISIGRALCTESIGTSPFRADWDVSDANNYEASDIKRFIDNWYHDACITNAKKECSQKTFARPSKDDYYLGIALAVSKRSTCLKRHYGAVIVKNDEIIATGYNGAPRGVENCCDRGSCPRMNIEHNSGNYADCPAVHAEQNAVISASRRDMIGATLYLAGEEMVDGKIKEISNAEPCPICRRIIANSGVEKIVTKSGIIQIF